jgi:hypothetical protein
MEDYVASVFISYAHADKPFARQVADGLAKQGCRVWIDEGELRIGDSLIERISEALDRVDFVAVLVSAHSVNSEWCRKELSLAMTGEILRKGVVVLPVRVDDTPMPDSIKDKAYLDVRRAEPQAATSDLMNAIRRHLDPPPPLPPRRARTTRAAVSNPDASHSDEPIRLIGVDEAGIGQPRGGGGRGSALYRVPFLLSRVPDERWANAVIRHWDRPPQFTTMHRPGIARVQGNRFILDGTTMEEVENYHLATLKLVIRKTNEEYAEIRGHERAAKERQVQASEQHRKQVRDTLGRLSFE